MNTAKAFDAGMKACAKSGTEQPRTASEGELEVECIVACSGPDGKKGPRYLVRWKDGGPKGGTWEPPTNIKGSTVLVVEFHKKLGGAAPDGFEKLAAAGAGEKKSKNGRSNTVHCNGVQLYCTCSAWPNSQVKVPASYC